MTGAAPALSGLLADIAIALAEEGPIETGTMFHHPGLRTGNKIVAFIGRDDRLIVKLPRPRAVALIDDGAAAPVTLGTRTMREWVSIPTNEDLDTTREAWTELTREALRYVRQGSTAGGFSRDRR